MEGPLGSSTPSPSAMGRNPLIQPGWSRAWGPAGRERSQQWNIRDPSPRAGMRLTFPTAMAASPWGDFWPKILWKLRNREGLCSSSTDLWQEGQDHVEFLVIPAGKSLLGGRSPTMGPTSLGFPFLPASTNCREEERGQTLEHLNAKIWCPAPAGSLCSSQGPRSPRANRAPQSRLGMWGGREAEGK